MASVKLINEQDPLKLDNWVGEILFFLKLLQCLISSGQKFKV